MGGTTCFYRLPGHGGVSGGDKASSSKSVGSGSGGGASDGKGKGKMKPPVRGSVK